MPQRSGKPDSSQFPAAFRPRLFVPFQWADRHRRSASRSAGYRIICPEFRSHWHLAEAEPRRDAIAWLRAGRWLVPETPDSR